MNGGSVLVSIGALDGTDDGNGILWTSTPTLPAGTYNVYLFFWNNATGLWDISAASGQLTSFEGLTDYTKDNATNISAATVTQFDGYDLPTDLKKDDGNQDLFAVKLGQVVLTSDGVITVSTAGRREIAGDDRTWFDGIGYQKIEGCSSIPPVTIEKPIAPGATSVTVTGISPTATSVNVYLGTNTLIGSAAGSPPNTPSTLTVVVAPLVLNDQVSARQTVAGQESCAPAPEVTVWAPLRITYVDADPNTDGADGNTTINSAWVNTATGGNATTSTSAGSGSDGRWHVRVRTTVNGGEVWEAGGAEVPPVLITTLSLPAGLYDLYGLFWNNAGNAGLWDVQFRVGLSGLFSTFNQGNAILSAADGGDFVNATMTRDDAGNYQVLLIAPLGRFALTGPVDIHVNPADLVSSGDDRTWYDGIGYAPVCNVPFADADGDQDVDQGDFGVFQACYTGPGGGLPDNCACFNRQEGGSGCDDDVDADDLSAFVDCVTGPGIRWSRSLQPDCVP